MRMVTSMAFLLQALFSTPVRCFLSSSSSMECNTSIHPGLGLNLKLQSNDLQATKQEKTEANQY